MHDHAGGFIDDQKIRILINDVQVVVFGLRGGADRLWNVDRDRLARTDDAVRRHRVPGDGHLAVLDEPLNLRPRLSSEDARQVPIDPDARFVGRDKQIVAKHDVIVVRLKPDTDREGFPP